MHIDTETTLSSVMPSCKRIIRAIRRVVPKYKSKNTVDIPLRARDLSNVEWDRADHKGVSVLLFRMIYCHALLAMVSTDDSNGGGREDDTGGGEGQGRGE
mmetsp:Transcript_42698/g.129709  ORF Transcript_42698/g.129709 Transcript_42698/m.129709 type:complete len:100 (-) Transcript_42698:607-906(-)